MFLNNEKSLSKIYNNFFGAGGLCSGAVWTVKHHFFSVDIEGYLDSLLSHSLSKYIAYKINVS